MSDIKLFRTGSKVEELVGTSVAIEKSLQVLFESNLDAFLGVRKLASEYSTGAVHGGRIDTLGMDENNCPVILEYKRATNENVINQGLYYLDWLLDHKGEFQLLVQTELGIPAAQDIDWTSPRLICVAGDYTKFDQHAVQQINRHIELFRYKRYGDELLMLELVNVPHESKVGAVTKVVAASSVSPQASQYKTMDDYMKQASEDLLDLYHAFNDYMQALGDDIQVKRLKYYEAYKRIRNIACLTIQVQTKSLVVTVGLNPDDMVLEDGFTRNVRNIGHRGTGDLEVILHSMRDLERAKPLLNSAYEHS